ncbi:unnamed protein product [Didymodactylos carnosus]|uniref:Lipase maturation factor 1/2 C-terminal domain-containing protein n=1 Tax=Didymodactylos carnosus TaxID=1234261 RepID=A0A816G6U9_9BILA|nr:unnamed protein product [Didymodactylos carnosus]CAF4642329.1 unnamed protein product [Didymodactylos carnosus]
MFIFYSSFVDKLFINIIIEQMWFAALSNYQHEAWLANFLYRLLTNQNEVLKLINYSPFANKSPKYLRVMLYRYNFRELGSSN